MRLLLIHNRYRFRGGEDRVFEDEVRLLLGAGHEVIPVSARWENPTRWLDLPSRASQAVWNKGWAEKVRQIIRRFRPDVLHAHNLFPVISPSVLAAARAEGVATVVTLHNYRLICPAATLFRKGGPCEDCVGRIPWRGVVHGCYHESVAHSAAVAWMIHSHRRGGAWVSSVDRFIVPSEFAQSRLAAGGLPVDRMVVKPHAVHPDPGLREGGGDYVFWAGRLSVEKGVHLLLDAWKRLPDIPLRIAGTGPLEGLVRRAESKAVRYLGALSRADLVREMKGARFFLSTSLWYETFGMVVAEAFACGLAAVLPTIGALAEHLEDGKTGVGYRARDEGAVVEAVKWAWEHVDEMAARGRLAREIYERRYTAARSLEGLRKVYSEVLPASPKTMRGADAVFL